MKTYFIYYAGIHVGTEHADDEAEAIFTFHDEHPGYNTWNLSAFEVDIP